MPLNELDLLVIFPHFQAPVLQIPLLFSATFHVGNIFLFTEIISIVMQALKSHQLH